MQINPRPWQDTHQQFAQDPEAERVDREYFKSLIVGIAGEREALDLRLQSWSDIPPHELDPVEHAALWLGLHELESNPEVPYRVVLSEATQLARQFGGTDGYKFVNAVLDRAARVTRAAEYSASP